LKCQQTTLISSLLFKGVAPTHPQAYYRSVGGTSLAETEINNRSVGGTSLAETEINIRHLVWKLS